MRARTIPIAEDLGDRPAPRARRRVEPTPPGLQAVASSESPSTALTVAEQVHAWLGDASRARDQLIEHLHRLQDRCGHLGPEHLAALAHEMGLAQSELDAVAACHRDFVRADAAPVPAGEAASGGIVVRICDGLSCELAGAAALRERLPEALGAEVRVLAVPCLGRCDHAPAVLVGQRPVAPASVSRVQARVRSRQTVDRVEGHVDFAAYQAQGGYRLLRRCVAGEFDVDSVLQAIEASALHGRGGGGSTVHKWRAVRAAAAPRLMVVNLGETEPGSFKDRQLLERDPHRVLEGALIAAWAVGVARIYLYLRNDYHGTRAMLETELERLRASPPYLGMPELILRRGGGSYVTGEASALIEAIEGKAGRPRAPTSVLTSVSTPALSPGIAQVGLFGRPTLVHNAETLHWVRQIVEQGGAAFAALGVNGGQGLRAYSVSGRVRLPGVKLAPAGITIRALIDGHCGGMQDGHRFYGYLPGGARGGILPASMGDIALDHDTLQAHGCTLGPAAVVVLSQQDRAVDAARAQLRFLQQQACGQCAPCVDGSAEALALTATDHWDAPRLARLAQSLRAGSMCGLGQDVPQPIESVLRYFPHELSLLQARPADAAGR